MSLGGGFKKQFPNGTRCNNALYLSPQRGGLLSTLDKEGLSVLDITMKDRPSHVVFKTAGKENY